MLHWINPKNGNLTPLAFAATLVACGLFATAVAWRLGGFSHWPEDKHVYVFVAGMAPLLWTIVTGPDVGGAWWQKFPLWLALIASSALIIAVLLWPSALLV